MGNVGRQWRQAHDTKRFPYRFLIIPDIYLNKQYRRCHNTTRDITTRGRRRNRQIDWFLTKFYTNTQCCFNGLFWSYDHICALDVWLLGRVAVRVAYLILFNECQALGECVKWCPTITQRHRARIERSYNAQSIITHPVASCQDAFKTTSSSVLLIENINSF